MLTCFREKRFDVRTRANALPRPSDLPDFANPPLGEVVLGIQFDPPHGYQQIRAGEVWALFRDAFPNVQELPPLPPTFETFGLPQGPQLNFGFVTGASSNRFWFVSRDGDELIQFQSDRLLHNWRKVGDQSNEYPRFDAIAAKFEDEARRLEHYFSGLQSQALVVRQCEISYINHIGGSRGTEINPSDWLTFVSIPGTPPNDFACSFRRIIHSEKGQPQGRLTCESVTAIEPSMQQLISLTLTARGVPDRPDVPSAIDFLGRGRDMIVRLFAEVTTDSAHKLWGRMR